MDFRQLIGRVNQQGLSPQLMPQSEPQPLLSHSHEGSVRARPLPADNVGGRGEGGTDGSCRKLATWYSASKVTWSGHT